MATYSIVPQYIGDFACWNPCDQAIEIVALLRIYLARSHDVYNDRRSLRLRMNQLPDFPKTDVASIQTVRKRVCRSCDLTNTPLQACHQNVLLRNHGHIINRRRRKQHIRHGRKGRRGR